MEGEVSKKLPAEMSNIQFSNALLPARYQVTQTSPDAVVCVKQEPLDLDESENIEEPSNSDDEETLSAFGSDATLTADDSDREIDSDSTIVSYNGCRKKRRRCTMYKVKDEVLCSDEENDSKALENSESQTVVASEASSSVKIKEEPLSVNDVAGSSQVIKTENVPCPVIKTENPATDSVSCNTEAVEISTNCILETDKSTNAPKIPPQSNLALNNSVSRHGRNPYCNENGMKSTDGGNALQSVGNFVNTEIENDIYLYGSPLDEKENSSHNFSSAGETAPLVSGGGQSDSPMNYFDEMISQNSIFNCKKSKANSCVSTREKELAVSESAVAVSENYPTNQLEDALSVFPSHVNKIWYKDAQNSNNLKDKATDDNIEYFSRDLIEFSKNYLKCNKSDIKMWLDYINANYPLEKHFNLFFDCCQKKTDKLEKTDSAATKNANNKSIPCDKESSDSCTDYSKGTESVSSLWNAVTADHFQETNSSACSGNILVDITEYNSDCNINMQKSCNESDKAIEVSSNFKINLNQFSKLPSTQKDHDNSSTFEGIHFSIGKESSETASRTQSSFENASNIPALKIKKETIESCTSHQESLVTVSRSNPVESRSKLSLEENVPSNDQLLKILETAAQLETPSLQLENKSSLLNSLPEDATKELEKEGIIVECEIPPPVSSEANGADRDSTSKSDDIQLIKVVKRRRKPYSKKPPVKKMKTVLAISEENSTRSSNPSRTVEKSFAIKSKSESLQLVRNDCSFTDKRKVVHEAKDTKKIKLITIKKESPSYDGENSHEQSFATLDKRSEESTENRIHSPTDQNPIVDSTNISPEQSVHEDRHQKQMESINKTFFMDRSQVNHITSSSDRNATCSAVDSSKNNCKSNAQIQLSNPENPESSSAPLINIRRKGRNGISSSKCLYADVGKKFMDINDFPSLILEWNPNWLVLAQRGETEIHHFICDCHGKIKDSYTNELDYYNTYFPLHLLSIWLEISDTWKNCPPVFESVFEKQVEKPNFVKVTLTTVLSAADFANWPKREDVILCKSRKPDGGEENWFGRVCNLMVKEYSPPEKSSLKDRALSMKKVTFELFCAEMLDIPPMTTVRVQILCNIRIALLQNDALQHLNSSMKDIILDPKKHLSRWKYIELRFPRDLSYICESVTSRTVRITVIDTLDGDDAVRAITHLVIYLKRKGSPVLIGLKSEEFFMELATCLLKCGNLILAVKKRDVKLSEELRKFTLEELSTTTPNREMFRNWHVTLTLLSSVFLGDFPNAFADQNLTCVVHEAHLCTESETALLLYYDVKNLVLMGSPGAHSEIHPVLKLFDYNKSLFQRFCNAK